MRPCDPFVNPFSFPTDTPRWMNGFRSLADLRRENDSSACLNEQHANPREEITRAVGHKVDNVNEFARIST